MEGAVHVPGEEQRPRPKADERKTGTTQGRDHGQPRGEAGRAQGSGWRLRGSGSEGLQETQTEDGVWSWLEAAEETQSSYLKNSCGTARGTRGRRDPATGVSGVGTTRLAGIGQQDLEWASHPGSWPGRPVTPRSPIRKPASASCPAPGRD